MMECTLICGAMQPHTATEVKNKKASVEAFCGVYLVIWCPGEDSNLHARKGTGPQPAAYASSATRALQKSLYTAGMDCQWLAVAPLHA